MWKGRSNTFQLLNGNNITPTIRLRGWSFLRQHCRLDMLGRYLGAYYNDVKKYRFLWKVTCSTDHKMLYKKCSAYFQCRVYCYGEKCTLCDMNNETLSDKKISFSKFKAFRIENSMGNSTRTFSSHKNDSTKCYGLFSKATFHLV